MMDAETEKYLIKLNKSKPINRQCWLILNYDLKEVESACLEYTTVLPNSFLNKFHCHFIGPTIHNKFEYFSDILYSPSHKILFWGLNLMDIKFRLPVIKAPEIGIPF